MDEYEVAIAEAEKVGLRMERADPNLTHVLGHLVGFSGQRFILWKEPIVPSQHATMVRRFTAREIRRREARRAAS